MQAKQILTSLLAIGLGFLLCLSDAGAQQLSADTVWYRWMRDSVTYELYAGETFYLPRSERYAMLSVGLHTWLGSYDESFRNNLLRSGFYAIGLNQRWHLGGMHKGLALSLGLEAAWYHYVFDTSWLYMQAQAGVVNMQMAYQSLKRSQFSMLQLGLPLWWQWQTVDTRRNRRGFHAGVGVLLAYGLSSYTRLLYTDDQGFRQRVRSRGDYYASAWRYALMLEVGWSDLAMFLRYHLNEVFQSDKSAPRVQQIAVGLSLFLQQ